MKFKKLTFRLWFLTCKNRHLWRHHYLGTQGVIFIFSTKLGYFSPDTLIVEAMTIMQDQNMVNVPFLFLFDKSNASFEETEECLRSKISEGDYLYNIQHINFSNVKALEEVNYGLDWLSSEMKPLTID